MLKSLISALVLLLLAYPNQVLADDYKVVTSGVKYKPMGDYSTTYLKKILTVEVKDFETTPMGITFPNPQNGVKLYKVIYKTMIPEKNNQVTEASGLIAVPDVSLSGRTFPLVSWQHGTVYTKKEVPSQPKNSMETRLILANLGGNGYVVIGADYIGMGESSESNSYMVTGSSVQAMADMLNASKVVLKDLGVSTDKLFLSGWSQGAYNTQIFHRYLEQQGVSITATATASTPTSPWMLATRWIYKPTKYDAQWILGTVAQLLNSYERYYGVDGLVEDALRPEYVEQARDFYDNKLSWSDVSKSWPMYSKDFYKPEFAAKLALGENTFAKLLLKNQAYRWRSLTPSLYYWGASDEAIAPYIAKLPIDYQDTVGGAKAEAIYAGEKADHRGTFVFGVKDQKEWFDGFK
ncbi:MAG: alpha/beta hydrolase family protein [Campylobacterales bacterium]